MKIFHHPRFQYLSLLCLVLFWGPGDGFAKPSNTQVRTTNELHTANWKDRKKAVVELEKIYPATPQVVDALRQALQDSSQQVRSQTLETIRIIKKLGSDLKPLTPDLIVRLNHPQEKSSIKADIPPLLFQVSEGSPEVVKELLKLAKDPKEEILIRWRSLRVLGEVEMGGDMLRHGLRHLALQDPSSIIQSQAWLTIAHLQPQDDEIEEALVKMGKGAYGRKHLLHADVTSNSFYPLSEALNMLMSLGKWESVIPLFLDALDQTNDRIPLDSRRFAYYLQEHPARALPYVPRLLAIVARTPTHYQQVLARAYLMAPLVKVAPHSPALRKILDGLEKNTDPEIKNWAKTILHCIDPQVPKSVKEEYPCTGIQNLPSVNSEELQKMEIRSMKKERGIE